MRKKNKLVYGVGINDADYSQQLFVDGKLVWLCQAYSGWKEMLKRCYSAKWHEKQPTYIGKFVSEEWKRFSNFKQWHDMSYVKGYSLDKDILVVGNCEYSKETCLYVPKWLNNFTTERGNARGDTPIGVCYYVRNEKYGAFVHDDGNKYLGLFNTSEEAHQTWRKAKLQLVHNMKDKLDIIDSRLFNCLVSRYENYGEKSE